SPIMWAEIGEGPLIGPKQKRKPLEFSVGEYVLLKVSPWKGVVHFGKKGKLAPRFVGPFEITERIGPVAYRLRLPEELNGFHDTFHVLNLKKCLADLILQVHLDEIQVDAKLNFMEEPVEILEREFKKLKRSRIPIVKVRWNSKCRPEFTWEREDQMKLKYSHLFSSSSKAIQADCDIKAINIILQGLPTEIYALVSQHRVAKELWEKIKLLIQGNVLSPPVIPIQIINEKTRSNPGQQATINKRVTLQPIQVETTYLLRYFRTYTLGASGSNYGKQRTVICYNCKGEGHMSRQCTNKREKGRMIHGLRRKCCWTDCDDELNSAKVALMVNLSHYGSDALAEVHNHDNMNNNVAHQAVQRSEPTLSIRPTNVEVPKELPKVSMVNTSLKKLKYHLANFDVVVKERTTPTAITEDQTGLREIEKPLILELDHRVTKIIVRDRAFEQTYKQFYDSIKPDEKALAITALKDESQGNLKEKALVDNNVSNHPSDPELHQVNVEPITPKLLNKRTTHSAYIKHSQEEAVVLRDLVVHDRSGYQQKGRKPSQNDNPENGMEDCAESRPKSKNDKVRVNTEESAVKPEPELKNTIGCNLNPSDGPGKPNSIIMKTVKTKWALNQFQQPICVQLTKTVKTLKAQS
ncbi:putative reverse transcriptase domain-containing protein, partial [Tanacetum coccineum]